MTETQNEADATPDTKGDDSSLFRQPEGRDWFLVQHIWEADTAGISKPVTVWLNGAIISGTIISGKQFFKEVGQGFADAALGDSDAADLQRSLGQTYQGYSQLYEQDPPSDLKTFKPTYLHLKGARTFVGANFIVPSGAGGLLRVRISSVDAFMMGELQFG